MRGLVVPDVEEDFTADPVELFFDLAFVFAFAQLVAFIHHEHSLEGIARAALLFMLIWMPWSQFTWSANATSSNARVVRALFLVATVATMPMAASVQSAFGDGGLLFAGSMAVIFVMAVAAMASVIPDLPQIREAVTRYAIVTVTGISLIVVGAFLDGSTRIGFWLAGIAVFVYSTIGAGQGEWVVRPGHFTERHGLILIIALGEVIVAIGLPVVEQWLEEDGGQVGFQTMVALVLAGVFACLLFWSYFDRFSPGLEHRAEQIDGAAERGRLARDSYTYCHYLIVGGVILAAAALEEITLHPKDPLDAVWRWTLFLGMAGFLLGVVIAVRRAVGVWPRERSVAVIAIGVMLLLAGSVDGFWVLVGLDVILAVMIVAEHLRIEHN